MVLSTDTFKRGHTVAQQTGEALIDFRVHVVLANGESISSDVMGADEVDLS
jgi:hypothetical protein